MTTESEIEIAQQMMNEQMMNDLTTNCPELLDGYNVYYNSGTPGKRIQLIAWITIQFLYNAKSSSESAQAIEALTKLGFNVVRLHNDKEKKWGVMPTKKAHLV